MLQNTSSPRPVGPVRCTFNVAVFGTVPVVTRESARSSVSQFRYANHKSLTLPGFAYRPVEETVRETAAQFLTAKAAGAKAAVLPF